MRKLDLQGLIAELHGKYLELREGAVATYIPELRKADPDWFGIAVMTVDGELFSVGDAELPFTLQSISKPFAYGLALECYGRSFVHGKVGVEPTGDTFNSLIELERHSHRPHNPMINAGAIAITSMIKAEAGGRRIDRVLQSLSGFAGRDLSVDQAVFESERQTGHRNRAIAHLMRGFSMIGPDLDESLDVYFQQCATLVSCRDLAVMGASLAKGGVHPRTGARVLAADYARDILSLMFTCGMYDSAGEWAYAVGLPAKSGVSGGLLAIVPGRMGIAFFSPPLDGKGHSVRAVAACREFSERMGLHLFAVR